MTFMSKYPSLKEYKIPFEVNHTDTFVKWLMEIAEVRPFLDEYLGSPLEVQLLRKAKVRAITASNQIEGNRLHESEVTAVIKGKRIAGREKDIKEVQNYHEALDYAERLAEDSRKLSQTDFCDIQKLVTHELVQKSQSGRLRTVPVSVVNASTGKVITECPPPYALRDLMDDLWKWLDDTQGINPFARAFAFHLIAVSIHPFIDGNGRAVRLMQHLLLLKDGQEIARFVPSETAIMRQRHRYYSAIKQSQTLNSLHPILEFLAECFATAAKEVVQEGKSLLKRSAERRPEARQKKILQLAKKVQNFSIRDVLAELPNVPRRTIERDLENLVSDKKLKATGEKKARAYQALKVK